MVIVFSLIMAACAFICGFQIGQLRGESEGKTHWYDIGNSDGYKEGQIKGYKDGYDAGFKEGNKGGFSEDEKKSVLDVLRVLTYDGTEKSE